jgi:hypothetical protein
MATHLEGIHSTRSVTMSTYLTVFTSIFNRMVPIVVHLGWENLSINWRRQTPGQITEFWGNRKPKMSINSQTNDTKSVPNLSPLRISTPVVIHQLPSKSSSTTLKVYPQRASLRWASEVKYTERISSSTQSCWQLTIGDNLTVILVKRACTSCTGSAFTL